jgi:hypothetical protein
MGCNENHHAGVPASWRECLLGHIRCDAASGPGADNVATAVLIVLRVAQHNGKFAGKFASPEVHRSANRRFILRTRRPQGRNRAPAGALDPEREHRHPHRRRERSSWRTILAASAGPTSSLADTALQAAQQVADGLGQTTSSLPSDTRSRIKELLRGKVASRAQLIGDVASSAKRTAEISILNARG